MKDEDGISLAWEGFVRNHFTRIIATKGWIWKVCSWRMHSWTLLIHEEKQIAFNFGFHFCYLDMIFWFHKVNDI